MPLMVNVHCLCQCETEGIVHQLLNGGSLNVNVLCASVTEQRVCMCCASLNANGNIVIIFLLFMLDIIQSIK
jgi:hypothetical protein